MSEPARARRDDIETSHAAAASVADKQRESQREVYRVLRTHGPMTDEALVKAYAEAVRRGEVTKQSPSGIRTRRDELLTQGWVENTETKAPLESGRQGTVWAARREQHVEAEPEPPADLFSQLEVSVNQQNNDN